MARPVHYRMCQIRWIDGYWTCWNGLEPLGLKYRDIEEAKKFIDQYAKTL